MTRFSILKKEGNIYLEDNKGIFKDVTLPLDQENFSVNYDSSSNFREVSLIDFLNELANLEDTVKDLDNKIALILSLKENHFYDLDDFLKIEDYTYICTDMNFIEKGITDIENFQEFDNRYVTILENGNIKVTISLYYSTFDGYIDNKEVYIDIR